MIHLKRLFAGIVFVIVCLLVLLSGTLVAMAAFTYPGYTAITVLVLAVVYLLGAFIV